MAHNEQCHSINRKYCYISEDHFVPILNFKHMQYSIIQYYRCNIVPDPGNPDPDPEFYNAKKLTYIS